MRLDTKTGVWYRMADKLIIDEVPGVYGNVPVGPGDIVLDLGAHIGVTASLMLAKGARHVVAVEADPQSIPLLRKNLRGKPATVIWAAVADKPGRTAFYTRSDRPWVGSVIEDPDRAKAIVPTVPFDGLLKRFRPSIVKVDIEFSEYRLASLRALPDFVKTVAIEITIRYAGIFTGIRMTPAELRASRERAADLMACFEAQGFREHWRKDKRAKAGEIMAEPDDTGFEPMTKCACVTYVR